MKVINLVMRHERCHQMTKVGKLLKSNYTQLKFPPFLIFHLFYSTILCQAFYTLYGK